MSAGDHSPDTDASWQQFLGHHRGPLCQVHLSDGEHFGYTDYQILLPQLGHTAAAFVGAVDPTHSLAVLHHTLTTFFGTHLPHSRGENRTAAPGCP
jgi:hypothetical protein